MGKRIDVTEDIDHIDDVLARFEDWMHGQDGKDVTDCRRRLAIVRGRLKGFQKNLLIEMMQDDEKDGLYDVEPKTMKEQLKQMIAEVEAQHPYVDALGRKSYNTYNEGWSDACDALENKLDNFSPWHSLIKPIDSALEGFHNGEIDALELRKRLLSVYDLPASPSPWISVEDALPDLYEPVLTTTSLGWCRIMSQSSGAKNKFPSEVSHWMPLPQPPKSPKE